MAIQAEGEGYHGRFDWQQRGERMELAVSGPFSQGGVRLTGTASGVELLDGKGGKERAADADALLRKVTGLEMPVAGLRYWLLGRPAVGDQQGPQVDAQGRLLKLQQDGWDIDYRAYTDVDGLSLPRKVFLTRDEVSVRLVVEQWQL